MKLKLLHLNMFNGKLLDPLISYIKEHDFDIVQLQEVSGGEFNRNGHKDLFMQMRDALQYSGILARSMTKPNLASSYQGNATLYKTSITMKNQHVVWLQPFAEYETFPTDEEAIKQFPRNALHVELSLMSQSIHCINAHLAWGPTPADEPYKVEQGKILYDFMKTVSAPFVLSGDFNVTPDSQIIRWIDELGRNLTVENNVTNTLNSSIHRAKGLFPAGLAVDYIYISKDVKSNNFTVIKENLSDHLGLSIEIEV